MNCRVRVEIRLIQNFSCVISFGLADEINQDRRDFIYSRNIYPARYVGCVLRNTQSEIRNEAMIYTQDIGLIAVL